MSKYFLNIKSVKNEKGNKNKEIHDKLKSTEAHIGYVQNNNVMININDQWKSYRLRKPNPLYNNMIIFILN